MKWVAMFYPRGRLTSGQSAMVLHTCRCTKIFKELLIRLIKWKEGRFIWIKSLHPFVDFSSILKDIPIYGMSKCSSQQKFREIDCRFFRYTLDAHVRTQHLAVGYKRCNNLQEFYKPCIFVKRQIVGMSLRVSENMWNVLSVCRTWQVVERPISDS